MPRSDRSLRIFLHKLLADLPNQEKILAVDLLARIEQRGFAMMMVICTALCMIPMPGPNAILTIPLMIITAQMILGFDRPWLPRLITRRSIKRVHLQTGLDTLTPILAKLEWFIKPRFVRLIPRRTLRPIGIVGFILALIIALPIPIPGANLFPALCVLMMGLALLNRDGLVLWGAAAAGLILSAKIVFALAWVGGKVAEQL